MTGIWAIKLTLKGNSCHVFKNWTISLIYYGNFGEKIIGGANTVCTEYNSADVLVASPSLKLFYFITCMHVFRVEVSHVRFVLVCFILKIIHQLVVVSYD